MIARITRIDRALQGAPDDMLTVGLLGVAAVCIVVALAGDSLMKAAVLAWAVLP